MADLRLIARCALRPIRNESGESLPEVLVGMLIACMATVVLVTMTMTASSSAAKTRIASQDMWDQETAIARSTASSPGSSGDVTAQVSSGSVTLSAGSVTKSLNSSMYGSDDFTYYEIAPSSKAVTSQSFANLPGDDGEAGGE